MRIAYFDCASGISGDMTLGALLDAGASVDNINAVIRSLGLEEVRVTSSVVKKCGFRALQVRIEHPPEKAHRHLHHIEAMFDRGAMTVRARQFASQIFRLIGEAEAKVHGVEIKKVHFHEVGAIDSIADIVGVSVALDELAIDFVEASPVPTGQGSIQIDHGLVSIPAPATAELLCGVPMAASEQAFELTTPTGAAILKATCRRYGGMPEMTIQKIGYGSGTRDLPGQPNVLRVLIGDAAESSLPYPSESDRVWVLETNIDDSSGSELAVVVDRLWEVGALDVYQTPCVMKKGRSGVQVTVLCAASNIEALERVLFSSGVTIGVRRHSAERHKLIRKAERVETKFGSILGKLTLLPSGDWRFAPELDSLREVASRASVSMKEVHDAAMAAYRGT